MIEIYTTASCPKCTIIKGLLNKRGIDYSERKLVSQEEKDAFIAKYNVRAVPLVVYNGQVIGDAKAAAEWVAVEFKET